MAQVIKNSQIEEVPDSEVDLEIQSPSRLVGPHANVVPMFNNAQSARLFYAARFVNQAMPLKNREAPLVQSLDPESPDGKSFEELFGRKVSVISESTTAFLIIITQLGPEARYLLSVPISM